MIGSGDLEHYYGGLVLEVAQLMSGYSSGIGWDSLRPATKTIWLNRANKTLRGLVNNADNVTRLRNLLDKHGALGGE